MERPRPDISMIDYPPGNERIEMDPESENSEPIDTEPTKLYPGKFLKGTRFKLHDLEEELRDIMSSETYTQILKDVLEQGTTVPCLELTPRDVTRWKMAWRVIQERQKMVYLHHFVKRCKDWPDLDDMIKLPIALTFSATALIYGGLHALAWHAYFKSPTEQLLWRISACIVMGGMPLALLAVKLEDTLVDTFNLFTRFIHSDLDDYLCVILANLLLLAYALARAYLVVECFINLAHLPAEVYDVPSWASYFPHIS